MSESLNNLSDEQLMEKIRDSADSTYFEPLVQRYSRLTLQIAFNALGNRSDAEDVVQEAFLRIIRFRQTYQAKRRFRDWYLSIVRNLIRDEMRRKSAKNSVTLNIDEAAPTTATSSKTESELKASEIVKAAADILSTQDLEILHLRIQGQLSYPEISAQCGISAQAVKKRAYRALEKLRKVLGKTLHSFHF